MTNHTPSRALLVIPVGTQIVTRVEARNPDGELVAARGAVGVVVAAPTDSDEGYRVRFLDGAETTLRRADLAVRKHFQRDSSLPASATPASADLYAYVIYRCVVGSRAYGLDRDGSDTDRRGIYLPPADLHWSLAGLPEQLEDRATADTYWELQKFLTMALKANPNVLECLYTPLVEQASPLAQELLALRAIFLSRLVYQTYNGYVMSQFRKLEQDLRTRGEVRCFSETSTDLTRETDLTEARLSVAKTPHRATA